MHNLFIQRLPLIMLCIWTAVRAQTASAQPDLFIYTGTAAHPMHSIESQTIQKRSWSIQGFNVKRSPVRCFQGAHARQVTDAQPTWAIYPRTQHLNDYALIRLKEKKNSRCLPSPDVRECDYRRIDIRHFRVENLPDMGFAVTPTEPLAAGEYILVDLTQEGAVQGGDIRAYDFRVENGRQTKH